ncbi:acyl-CoA carboxylase subunit beta [Alicyclobacillus fastidiosus]|uniref:Acyl-CoA carboxylase subunit beta n=2 Tax=Alicyclobacillus fastidiosus TaxID=392011 RepID=A0ABV5AFZ5_9BACL|nr:acyl-CoA carboxylase subunit beta [Alicyclobacillus fastidiosus]WEH11752.1 acyl-CoA carboxylase subunit beta [Alicyclobacillus fastidiosus]
MRHMHEDPVYGLQDRRRKVELGGGDQRILAQHEKGKGTARERIDWLLDAGSFRELGTFAATRSKYPGLDEVDAPGEGVVTGYGTIEGRTVFVFAQDFTVFGGALGEVHADKIASVMDHAAKTGAPVIGLCDSGGARIQEGVVSLDGYGHVFYRNAIYSGVIPQISVIMGPCAGGAVYSPALTDFVVMVEGTSQMFITGPKVIQTVTGEVIETEALGGARVQQSKSGVAHFTAASEADALQQVRRLLQYIPSSNRTAPPVVPFSEPLVADDRLREVVPQDGTKVYDVKDVIHLLVDPDSFFEVQPLFARNAVVGFGRMQGHVIGIVANQPKFMAGGLDIDSSDKIARFIRFCDSFHIPLLTLEDVTGFIPGVKQEHGGIIRHGAKILYAYAEATVPKITVIVRKAYGGAYVAMNSKAIGADMVFAWPSAEIAVMGPEGAASIIYHREIAASPNPGEALREKIDKYREEVANPYVAAGAGMVDDVIDPRDTRMKLCEAFAMLREKQEERPRRKHGNIPL